MNKLIAIAIAIAFVAPLVSAERTGDTESKGYITAGIGLFAVTCAAGGHEYTPIGSPEDYQESDPTEDPIGFIFETEGWAWSGEPECLASDVATDNGEGAYFGIAWDVFPGNDEQMVASVTDDNFDSTYIFASGGVENVDGCGSVNVDIDPEMPRHDQSSAEDPYYLIWTWIDGTFVNPDTLETCFGSVGTVTSIYS